ncbi:MAG: PAS domain-containing protein, partial [Acidimicrobiia bacterium]
MDSNPAPTPPEDQEFFRLTADAAPFLVWAAGPERGRTYFNHRWLAYRGKTYGQESGGGWREGIHPDDRDRILSAHDAAFEEREPFEVEFRLQRADGIYRWILERGVPQYGDGGTFTGYVGSCVDVTEQRLDRKALHDTEERLTFALEAGQMGEWSFSVERGRIEWSPAMERLCGLEAGSFDGTLEAALATVHPEDVDAVRH